VAAGGRPRHRPEEPEKEGATSERKDSEIILGENGYPAGFDDQLLGAKPGDTREFELTWDITPNRPAPAEGEEEQPEPEKETRRATFTVAVKDVKRKELPAIDDAFAASVGEYESVDAMNADVRRRLYGEALRAARAAVENKAVEAAIERTTFEIPARLLEAETDALAQERSRSLAEQRITVERYLQIMGTSMEDWRNELRQQAERQLKARLVLDQLAERDGIEVDSAQVEQEIESTAMAYGEQADQVRRSLRTEDGQRRVATSLRRHLAIQRLVEAAGGYPADEMGVLSAEDVSRDAEGATAAGDADTGVPVAATEIDASSAGAADVTETVVEGGTGGA
jgi:trigger factor